MVLKQKLATGALVVVVGLVGFFLFETLRPYLAAEPFLLVKTLYSRHGNAARLAWNADGKTIYLANEEGIMAAVKIDVADPANPRIVGQNGDVNFLWAVAHKGDILALHPSYGGTTIALDPTTFTVLWKKDVGPAHAIATDGERIYLPIENGDQAYLLALDKDGNEVWRAPAPDPWPNETVYTCEVVDGKIYVGNKSSVYIFDREGQLLHKISSGTGDVMVRGTKLWKNGPDFGQFQAWDISGTPTMIGEWRTTESHQDAVLAIGRFDVTDDGTKAYAAYSWMPAPGVGGGPRVDIDAGILIFDVSGNQPQEIGRIRWKTDAGYYMPPLDARLSPDRATLAVSYWYFGIRLYRTSDQAVLGDLATTGEARDVYADTSGAVHVFAVDSIQTIHPVTGEHTAAYVPGIRVGGGWRPFIGDTVIVPQWDNGHERLVYRFQNGTVELVGTVGPWIPENYDNWYEAPYLYSVGGKGVTVQEVGEFNAAERRYPTEFVSPEPRLEDPALWLTSIVKVGHLIWAQGPGVGVVAFDVSDPASPREVFRDSFTWDIHGQSRIVAARGRIFAGVGDAGVKIYDALDPRPVGAFGQGHELVANWLELIGEDFLAVASYWYPTKPEGMYIYDLRLNTDQPTLLAEFPWGANFRIRFQGDRLYRVPLYGVDILEVATGQAGVPLPPPIPPSPPSSPPTTPPAPPAPPSPPVTVTPPTPPSPAPSPETSPPSPAPPPLPPLSINTGGIALPLQRPAVVEVRVENQIFLPTDAFQIEQGKDITLNGTAQPNEEMTIYIASEEKKLSVTADRSGNWSFDVWTRDLAEGEHHVDLAGANNIRYQVLSFTVLPAGQPTTIEERPVPTRTPTSREFPLWPVLGGVALLLVTGLLLGRVLRSSGHLPLNPTSP